MFDLLASTQTFHLCCFSYALRKVSFHLSEHRLLDLSNYHNVRQQKSADKFFDSLTEAIRLTNPSTNPNKMIDH